MKMKSINIKGMGLFEVIMSIAIASIVIVGLATYMVTSARANFSARRIRQATLYGEKKLEDLKTTAWASLSNGQDKIEIFTRKWTLTTDATSARLKKVIIEISWYDVFKKKHSIKVSNYIYKPTP